MFLVKRASLICSLILLLGGCEDNPILNSQIDEINITVDPRLQVDTNGYYHLSIDTTRWQTLHRISGHVYRDSMPVNIIKFGWASSHYWIVGDNFGYVICNTGLTDYGMYVGYDTTYITWFGGAEVPIVNGSSYSREDGEVNTVIAPVKTMIGDTATIFYAYYDNWREEETYGEFYVIFD